MIYTIRPEKPPENWKEKLLKAPREYFNPKFFH
jgi:hypothetical protein